MFNLDIFQFLYYQNTSTYKFPKKKFKIFKTNQKNFHGRDLSIFILSKKLQHKNFNKKIQHFKKKNQKKIMVEIYNFLYYQKTPK